MKNKLVITVTGTEEFANRTLDFLLGPEWRVEANNTAETCTVKRVNVGDEHEVEWATRLTYHNWHM